MYKTTLKAGPSIDISYRSFTFQYAINGEAPNPLEAMYASIAGCAGVFTLFAGVMLMAELSYV